MRLNASILKRLLRMARYFYVERGMMSRRRFAGPVASLLQLHPPQFRALRDKRVLEFTNHNTSGQMNYYDSSGRFLPYVVLSDIAQRGRLKERSLWAPPQWNLVSPLQACRPPYQRLGDNHGRRTLRTLHELGPVRAKRLHPRGARAGWISHDICDIMRPLQKCSMKNS